MVLNTLVNNYNSNESIDSYDGNSSDTDPDVYFKNLSLQFFSAEPLRMMNQYI